MTKENVSILNKKKVSKFKEILEVGESVSQQKLYILKLTF